MLKSSRGEPESDDFKCNSYMMWKLYKFCLYFIYLGPWIDNFSVCSLVGKMLKICRDYLTGCTQSVEIVPKWLLSVTTKEIKEMHNM